MNLMVQRAWVLYDLKRYDLAVKEAGKALSSEPNDAYGHRLMAWAYYQQNQMAKALEEAELAVTLAPTDPYAHYCKGCIAKDIFNHLCLAKEAACEAIRLEPRKAEFYALLARVQLQKGQFREEYRAAVETAKQGLAVDPNNVSCLLVHAAALRVLGRHWRARQVLDIALQQHPEDSCVHLERAQLHLERHEHGRARRHFREALRLNPQLLPCVQARLRKWAPPAWCRIHYAFIAGVIMAGYVMAMAAARDRSNIANATTAIRGFFQLLAIFFVMALFLVLHERAGSLGLGTKPADDIVAEFLKTPQPARKKSLRWLFNITECLSRQR